MAVNIRRQSINKVLIFLFLLSLPTQLGKYFWPSWSLVWGIRVDYLSPAIFLSDILLFPLLLINSKDFAFFILRSFKNVYFLATLFLAIFNIVFALLPQVAFFKWLKLSEVLFIFWLVRQYKKRFEKAIFWTIPLWLAMETVLGSGQWIKKENLGGWWWWLGERDLSIFRPGVAKLFLFDRFHLRAYGTFSHPNSLAGFVLLSLLAWRMISKRLKRNPWVEYSVLLSGAILLLLAFSKAVFLTVAVLLFWLWRKRAKLTVVSLMLSLFLISLTLSLLIQDPTPFLSRFFLAQTALKTFLSSPLWGAGLGNFPAVGINFANSNYPSEAFLQPVHNIFLLVLSETGIWGFVLFCRGIWLLRRSCCRKIFWAFVLTGLFDHYWLTLQQNLFLLATLSGLCFNQKKDDRKNSV